jgi:Ser/Thr protein kinase RdoA (MazF antagonist)
MAVPLSVFDSLPAGWVHGDYHGRNMVFVGSDMRGLFDFDPLNRGRLLEDVAAAVFRFARERRGSLTLRPDVARVFLDEYDAVRPLTAAERGLLPEFGELGWIERAHYYRILQRDGDDWTGHMRLYCGVMRTVRSELERLRSLGVFDE